MNQEDSGDECGCIDCVKADEPCKNDCYDRDEGRACLGCWEEKETEKETNYEIDKAQGRI